MTKDTKAQVAEAVKAFNSVFNTINNEIEAGLMMAGAQIEGDAKRGWKGREEESVKGEVPRVQTGRLRGSITHRLMRIDGVASVEIGSNVSYAKDVEMGTSQTWPHPFLTPALNKTKPNIRKYIESAIKKTVQAGTYAKH